MHNHVLFSVEKRHVTRCSLLLNSCKIKVLNIHSKRSHHPLNPTIVCGSTVISQWDEVMQLIITLDSGCVYTPTIENDLRLHDNEVPNRCVYYDCLHDNARKRYLNGPKWKNTSKCSETFSKLFHNVFVLV